MTNFIIRLPSEVINIINVIKTQQDVYLVGGFVRDFLRGLGDFSDIDIAVRDVASAINELKKSFPISDEGKEFGVYKVYYNAKNYVDIASFRNETYDMKSRKPVVAPVSTIEEDLGRRDFTINAMAFKVVDILNNYEVAVELIDPFNGQKDLKENVVRFVGNPDIRIMEDPLRILRGLRFTAKFNATLEQESERAITELRNELKRISKERIRDELVKGLLANPDAFVSLLDRTRVLDVLFDNAQQLREVKHDNRPPHHGESVIEHTIEALANLKKLHSLNKYNTIAVLLHDIAKPETVGKKGDKITFYGHAEKSAEMAEDWLREMKFSNRDIDIITKAIAQHMNIHIAEDTKNRKILAKVWIELRENPEIAELALQIAEADQGKPYEFVRELFKEFQSIPKLITGDIAVQLGIPPEQRGEWLKKVRLLQLTQGIRDEERLMKMAKGLTLPSVA